MEDLVKKQAIEEMAQDLNMLDTLQCDFRYSVNYQRAKGLYSLGYRKQEWISVEERLPEENEYVLIWVDKVQVARIEKGISEETRQKMKNGELPDPAEMCFNPTEVIKSIPRSALYRAADVFGNNKVPYIWKANGGPMEWFGQCVTHWMPLPEPPKMKGGAE